MKRPNTAATNISRIISTPSQKPWAAMPKSISDWRIAIVAKHPILVSATKTRKGALVLGVVHRRAELDGSGMRVFGHDVPRTESAIAYGL